MTPNVFADWIDAAAGAAAAPFGASGPEVALGLSPEFKASLAAEVGTSSLGRLGASGTIGPMRQHLQDVIGDTFFRAADLISDGVAHHFMALQEQGELLTRYKNLYGIVKDSADPNARCPNV